MHGRWWACLVALVLLAPAAAAGHKDDRGLVGAILGGDDDEDDGERDKDGDRDGRDEDNDRDDRDERRGKDPEGRTDAAGSSTGGDCIEASGGATKNGNVVAWSAQPAAVDVHRRAGDGDWTQVHEAEPEDTMFIDHDVKKGDTYAYRVVPEGARPGDCPHLEMTAVPFFPPGFWIGALAGVAGAGGAWMLRRGAPAKTPPDAPQPR